MPFQSDYDIQPSDLVLTTECDYCGLYDYDEDITIIDGENLCKDCAENEGYGPFPGVTTKV